MKINNILHFCLVLIATLTVSCQQDYDATGSCSDVAWYTSETVSQGNDYLTVNIDSFISFKNLSQGCTSNKWIIEEGSRFMIDKFNYKLNLKDQIDPKKGLESKNITESVFFGKAGLTKVVLVATFNKWVTSHDKNPVQAEWNGNQWVLTKEFQVDVFDRINPSFSISLPDGEEALFVDGEEEISSDQSTWKTIEVYTGQEITFTDKTTIGRPTAVKWSVTGSDQKTSGKSVAKFTFSTPNAKGYTGFSIVSSREKPAANANKIIPIKIIVKDAPLSFITDNMMFVDSHTVSIPTNANGLNLNGVSQSDFTVSAKLASGSTIQPTISDISLSSNLTSVILKFNESFEEGDKLTISYVGDKIASSSNVALEHFEKATVECNISRSLLDNVLYGFEQEGSTIVLKGWYVTNTTATDIVTDPYDSNNHVLKFENVNNINKTTSLTAMTHSNNALSIPAGSYKMSVKVRASVAKAGTIKLGYKTTTTCTISDVVIPDEAVNGWVVLSGEFKSTQTITAMRLVFGNGCLADGATVYFDDIKLLTVE